MMILMFGFLIGSFIIIISKTGVSPRNLKRESILNVFIFSSHLFTFFFAFFFVYSC
jgi:hypothetical protein